MTITASSGRPRASRHDFSPAAIMARATAYAAESAARWAARHAVRKSTSGVDLRSPDELLAEIRAIVARGAGAPLPPLTSALASRRAIFGAFDGEATRG